MPTLLFMKYISFSQLITPIFFATLFAITGCVTEEVNSNKRDRNTPLPRLVEPGDIARTNVPTSSHSASTHLVPIGVIPFNRATLPIVSPDGRFVATEVGGAPDVPTSHADYRATVPENTGVEIYALSPTDNPQELTSKITLIATLNAPLLLGRSANLRGFTVEAPQPNGSRWIGFVEWETGNLTWLVQDAYINAFAALGSGDGIDKLAWSRRTIEGKHFELVVRDETGEWTHDTENADWLYPTWTIRGDGLFAFLLTDDNILYGNFMNGNNQQEMLDHQDRIRLSNRANRLVAFQTTTAFPAMMGHPEPKYPRLMFFHPEYLAVAVWRPFRAGPTRAKVLEKGSFAGAIASNGFTVYAVGDELIGKPLDLKEPRIRLTPEHFVPRLTESNVWPFVLVAPMGETPKMMIVGLAMAEYMNVR